jgi:Ala-tRNA(Pro) deacylase
MTGKERLEAYLRENGVGYEIHHHPEAFTAQEVAAAEHVPGRMLGKVVAVKAGDDIAMVVVPAPAQVDLDKAATAVGTGEVRIATEDEFGAVFSDCDTGAMPPFGNGTLYDVPVFVDNTLAQQETVVFDAGTHSDTVHLQYSDFERLVKPNVADLTD